MVAAKYSVPVEHVILSTIHTHSGPDISFEDEGEDRNRRKADYRSFLVNRVLAAVDECFDRGFLEVTPSVVQGTIEGVYGNRNYKDKPSDKDVNLILFRNENHVVAGIASLTCHPTVLGIHNMKIDRSPLPHFPAAWSPPACCTEWIRFLETARPPPAPWRMPPSH